MFVRVGIPEIDTPYTNWRCPFIIEGLGDDSIHFGMSDDSMASLQNAFTGIRCLLEQSGVPLRWEGFDEDITGFPKHLEWGYGLELYQRLEKVMETETETFLRERRERRAAEREAKRKARAEARAKRTKAGAKEATPKRAARKKTS